jgi:hypothetical protein
MGSLSEMSQAAGMREMGPVRKQTVAGSVDLRRKGACAAEDAALCPEQHLLGGAGQDAVSTAGHVLNSTFPARGVQARWPLISGSGAPQSVVERARALLSRSPRLVPHQGSALDLVTRLWTQGHCASGQKLTQ